MTIAYTQGSWITASSAQAAVEDSFSDKTLIRQIAQGDHLPCEYCSRGIVYRSTNGFCAL
jgi:hypothetical protein